MTPETVTFGLGMIACSVGWLLIHLRRPEPPGPVRPIVVTPPRFDVTTARRELVADETLRVVAAECEVDAAFHSLPTNVRSLPGVPTPRTPSRWS